MIFQSADIMLKYIQDGNDVWSPTLNKYVFLYNALGSICYYDDIDYDEAKNLQSKSEKSAVKEYWGAFLGIGGHICDTLKWIHHQKESQNLLNESEEYDYALEFCSEYYDAEWIDCDNVT